MFITIVVLAIVLAAVSMVLQRKNAARPEILAAYPAEGQILDIDGTQVHVVSEGTGPALLFIHGAGGSSREFTFSLTDALKDTYRVIAIDRPGHGYTGRIANRAAPAESPAEQAELINGTLEAMGVEQAMVMGQSYGGAVALAYALRYPDETTGLLVVSGVSNPWDDGLDTWYRVTNTWVGQNLLIPVIARLATQQRANDTVKSIFDPDPVPEGYLDHMGVPLALRPSQMRANTQQINGLLDHILVQSTQYGQLSMPVEIIHGTADITVPYDVHAKPLTQQIPHATVTTLEGAGHMPQHAHEDVLIAAIDRVAKRAGLR